ncbi:leucine-rich repeat extensin-like protein 3 [Pollicipes pollicipes]|uniref:leucine-rich repeat extensin-like protein 3 n=1 Tax=Pollicipes pollicipes TaxID=41117 RepID=UPI001884F1AD|nr:leucine-rich repeat extensin-like protein 3 [Pollicipes pollicipes]
MSTLDLGMETVVVASGTPEPPEPPEPAENGLLLPPPPPPPPEGTVYIISARPPAPAPAPSAATVHAPPEPFLDKDDPQEDSTASQSDAGGKWPTRLCRLLAWYQSHAGGLW